MIQFIKQVIKKIIKHMILKSLEQEKFNKSTKPQNLNKKNKKRCSYIS